MTARGRPFSFYMGNSGTLSGHGFPGARPPAYCSDRGSCRYTSDLFQVDEELLIMMGPKVGENRKGCGGRMGKAGLEESIKREISTPLKKAPLRL